MDSSALIVVGVLELSVDTAFILKTIRMSKELSGSSQRKLCTAALCNLVFNLFTPRHMASFGPAPCLEQKETGEGQEKNLNLKKKANG